MEFTTTPQVEGSWVPVVGLSGGFHECDGIPTRMGTECHFVVDCATAKDGWYRTRVTVHGSGNGGSFTYSPPEKPAQEIRCP